MKYSELNEIRARGTPDFPMELYRIDSGHSRYIMPFHWHNEFELIRVEEGSLHVIVGEEEHMAGPGDVVLVNCGLIHGGMPKDCRYYCVVFDLSMLYGKSHSGWLQDLRHLTDRHDGGIPCYFPHGESQVPALTAELIAALKRGEKGGGRLAALGAIYSILGLLLREKNPSGGELHARERMAGDSKMKAVLQWIEENYAEPVSLEGLAAVAGMNPHYFCEFFKRYTRRSPIDYLNLYRIDSACRMLKVSGCPVTEAAFACGFNDLSYFVKTFKKYKGVTPRQYRRRFEIEGLRE